MRRLLLLLVLVAIVFAGAWWGYRKRIAGTVAGSEVWQEQFSDGFEKETIGQEWMLSPQTRKKSKVSVHSGSLVIENDLYSPYSEIWLNQRFDGPVRMEFDVKVQLKPGGEFGVRMGNSQTEILPNTPGYEVYLQSLSTAVIKRADRDEQVFGPAVFPDEVRRGEKSFHFSAEKNFRKVRFWADSQLLMEYPDPEVLSGKKYDRCGLFLIAGKVEIQNFKVSVFPKSSESDMLAQAYEHYTAGDFPRALNLYDQFLKDQPAHRRALEARFRKALCYKHMERYTESVTILQGLQFNVVDEEYVPDALFFLGEIYQKIGQFDNAAKHYAGFIERFRKHPFVLKSFERLAVCQFSSKKYKEALDTTDTLIQKYPDSYTAIHSHYLRGQIFEALNVKDKAAEEYRSLIQNVQKDRVANLARQALKRLATGRSSDRVKAAWGKSTIQISYTPSASLSSSAQIFLHCGVNGWQNVQDVPLQKSAGAWKADLPREPSTRSIEFVFTDGQGTWDNNSGLNWEFSAP